MVLYYVSGLRIFWCACLQAPMFGFPNSDIDTNGHITIPHRRLNTLRIRTQSGTKRSLAAVIAAAMVASLLALVATPAGASASVATKRYSGLDRYATAAATAEATHASATRSILVSGENFADGLSASILSGAANAPVFLTQAAALPAVTAAAIGRVMGTNKVIYVIGGVNAVSAGVVTTLTGLGYTVTRISGADRAATAVAVAVKAKTFSAIGTHNALNTAIVVNDTAYADAVVAGGLSEAKLFPILLTNGSTLTPATKAAFATTSLNIKQVIIVGGTSAVSASVEASILADSNVSSIIRVGGVNRQDTAKLMAEKLTSSLVSGGFAWAKTKITVVNSNSFADALASAQFNGTNTAPLLYVGDTIPTETNAYITSAAVKKALTNIYAIGGTSAVPAAVLTEADALGTYATATVTVTALEGSNVLKFVFPNHMLATDMLLANVKINNAAIVNGTTIATADPWAVETEQVEGQSITTFTVAAHPYKVGNMIRATATDGGVQALIGAAVYGNGTVVAVDTKYKVIATTGTTIVVEGTVTTTADANGSVSTFADVCALGGVNTPLTTGNKTMTCYLATPLVAGDTVNISAIADLANGVDMTSTTVTVANDTVDPTVVSIGAWAGDDIDNVITFSGSVNGFDCADLTETVTAACSSVAPIPGTNSWTIDWADSLVAGETMKLTASKVTGPNGEINAAASSNYSVVTAAAAPSALSVTHTLKHTTLCFENAGTAEVVKIKAKAGTAADGVNCNKYKFAFVTDTDQTVKMLTNYTASSKTFTLTMKIDDNAVTENAVEAAAKLNAWPAFNALFTAEATTTADTGWDVTAQVAGTLATAGVTTVTGVMTYSQQLLPSSIDCTGIDLNSSSAAAGADIEAAACTGTTTGTPADAMSNKVTFAVTLNTASHATYNYPVAGATIFESGVDAVNNLSNTAPTALQKITTN
jgi:putative cell wall-binding protein